MHGKPRGDRPLLAALIQCLSPKVLISRPDAGAGAGTVGSGLKTQETERPFSAGQPSGRQTEA